MKHSFRRYATILSLAGVALFQSACREHTIIQANLVPSSDSVLTQTIDTTTVLAKTVLDDSVVTNQKSSIIVQGLGTVNDPFFGRTNASMYLQVLPGSAKYTFSDYPDSVFLILPYSGFSWGDISASAPKQHFTVYRVTDTLKKDETYYSFTNKAVDRNNPVSASVEVDVNKLKEEVTVLGEKRNPHLRIRLTNAFRDELVNAAANAGDNAAFLAAIKGLYIESTNPDNTLEKTLSYFVLNGASDYKRAALQFFYSKGGDTDSVRSAFFNFDANSTAFYNRITRNYSAEAQAYFNTSSITDSVVLLQNEPGAAIDLRFPHLKNLPVGIIHKAELVITAISFGDTTFSEPSRIFPVGIEPGGKTYTVLDMESGANSQGAAGFIDGTSRSVQLPNGMKVTRYVINIPREVQRAIVNKTNELHLRINGTQTFLGAYRLRAGGSHSDSTFKIELKITYSKL